MKTFARIVYVAPGLALTLVASLQAAPTPAADSWKAALEGPLSPGALAILIAHGNETGVSDRWQAALADAQPEIRAAGARAIYAAGATALLPDVAKALAREENVPAATEEVRALLTLSAPGSDIATVDAARRLPGLRHEAGGMLARAKGAAALEQLARFREFDDDGSLRGGLAQALCAAGPAATLLVADAALRDDDAVLWHAALSAGKGAIEPSLLASAPASTPALRAFTYWYLVAHATDGALEPARRAVLKSAEERPADAPALDANAAFALELLRRAGGAAAREDLAWAGALKCSERCRLPLFQAVALLTSGEREALTNGGHLPKRMLAPMPKKDADAPAPTPQDRALVLDPYRSFPRGWVTGLTHLAGCRPEKRTRARAEILYDRHGRPRSLTAGIVDGLPECEIVARVLFAASHQTHFEDGSASAPRVVDIGFLQRDELECLEEQEKSAAGGGALNGGVVGGVPGSPMGPVRVGGGQIQEPKKTRSVDPVYPRAAKEKRVQGIVILETLINPCGQVTSARILRGIPRLDEAAVTAVEQWRYTPTLLNGVAVPVIMTITVNFKLQ